MVMSMQGELLTSNERRERTRQERRQRFSQRFSGTTLSTAVKLECPKDLNEQAFNHSNPQAPNVEMEDHDSSTLEEWITAKNLGRYRSHLLDLASNVEDLQEMTDDDLQLLAAEAQMPTLAERRLRRALLDAGAMITPHKSMLQEAKP